MILKVDGEIKVKRKKFFGTRGIEVIHLYNVLLYIDERHRIMINNSTTCY